MTDSDTILLWGLPSDRPIAAVREALEQGGYRTMLVDQRLVLDSEIELFVGSTVGGRLRVGDIAVDLATVCYPCRPKQRTLASCN